MIKGVYMKSKSRWIALMLMIVMAFAGCSKASTEKQDVTPTTEPSITLEETATVEPTVTKVPEDTTKPQEEQKIVSFSPSITELIFALDAGDVLVGRTDNCDYPEQALAIDSIGSFYTPDVEKIVSLEPGMVFASSLWTDDVAQKFDEAGIKVEVFNESAKVEDVYTMISSLGAYLGKEDNASQLIESMNKDLTEITDKLKDVEPKSVYYVVGYGEYGEYTAGGDTFVGDLLTLAGGDNIAKDVSGWNYSLETLIEKDPEYIIIAQYMLDDFLASENYQNLSAVKNNKVYGIDQNLIERQTNRLVEGITTIAKILHPEVF